ncbi:hypothetical protein LY76DRAFT_590009 [Colletotrichum caudatum]|nr:hypothetical protein LY76DRAFT_590009 [Colletotrichum caudatum]
MMMHPSRAHPPLSSSPLLLIHPYVILGIVVRRIRHDMPSRLTAAVVRLPSGLDSSRVLDLHSNVTHSLYGIAPWPTA